MNTSVAAFRRRRTVALIRALRQVTGRRRRRAVPRARPPLTVEREYGSAIAAIVEAAHEAVVREIVPELAGWVDGERLSREDAAEVRTDAGMLPKVRTVVRRVASQFLDAISPFSLEALADRFASRTSEWSRAESRRQAEAAVGVDVFAAEPNLGPLAADFVAENVALIRTVPEKFFTDVEGTILRGIPAGKLPRDLADEIAEAGEVSKRRAMLIARDQVGKFYGKVNEARQRRVGVESYFWRDVGDNRVRPEHEERNGVEYAWTPEAAERLGLPYLPPEEQPGQPPLCRCIAEPAIGRLLDDLGV